MRIYFYQSISLTNSATADTLVLTAGNDTVTGGTGTLNGTGVNDLILDATTTDNDTANLTVNAAATPTVSNVENVNFNFAIGAGAVTATNVTGAKLIGVGSAEAGATAGSIAAAKTGNTFNVSSAMTQFTLTTDGTSSNTETATVVLNGTPGVAVTGAGLTLQTAATGAAVANDVDVLTLKSTTAANIVTLQDTAAGFTNTFSASGESIVVTGDKDLIIKTAATAVNTGLSGATVTKDASYTGKLTVEYTANINSDQNLAKIGADTIKLSGGSTSGTVTVASGAKVEARGDIDALTAITTANPDGVLNLSLTGDSAGGTITLNNFATVNLTTAESTGARSVAALTLGQASGLSGATLKVAGTQNFTTTGIVTAKAIDATGFAKDMTIAATGQATTVTGGDGIDTVTLGNFASTVNGGAGADVISATNITANKAVSINGGEGNDTITFGIASTTSTYDGGNGDDAFTLNANTKLVGNVIGGAGTDTITFGANYDVSGNTFTLATIDVINVAATNGANVFLASQLTGQTLNIVGDSTTDAVTVNPATAGTATAVNLGGINHNVGTTTAGVGTYGLTIVGSTAADNIIGSKGNDTIRVGNAVGANNGGADALAGGGGNDVFYIMGNTAAANGGNATSYATGFNISDFTVGTSAATTDFLQFSGNNADFASSKAGAFTAINSLSDGAGSADAAEAASVVSVAQNATAAAIGAANNFIKLTTGVAFTTDIKGTVSAAFGSASLTTAQADANYLVSYYDTTNSKAVIVVLNSGASTATDTAISAADATADGVQLVGTINMTAADYANFGATNISAFLG